LCRSCPARVDCVAASLANHETIGIWGGLSDRERRALRRTGEVQASCGDVVRYTDGEASIETSAAHPPRPADAALETFWRSAVGQRCA